MINFLRYHWHLWFGMAVGAAAGFVARRFGLNVAEAVVVGWASAAAAFLVPTGRMLLFADPETTRRHACREDENRAVLLGLVMVAVAMSFGAVIVALRDASGGDKQAAPWLTGLAFLTICLSWLVVQALFAVHYAHRYFGDPDQNGRTEEGFLFQGDPPASYRDFVYVAVCMGATCQVSDFSCTNVRIRNLVTAHAALAFLFNTVVLALGINIVASLMGGGGGGGGGGH